MQDPAGKSWSHPGGKFQGQTETPQGKIEQVTINPLTSAYQTIVIGKSIRVSCFTLRYAFQKIFNFPGCIQLCKFFQITSFLRKSIGDYRCCMVRYDYNPNLA